MQAQQGQQVLFLRALNRFQSLVVLRQHIRGAIMAFDDVTDQWESHHRELYDQPTENQLVMMQQTLHDLCQQITEEITRQQNELEGFIQAG